MAEAQWATGRKVWQGTVTPSRRRTPGSIPGSPTNFPHRAFRHCRPCQSLGRELTKLTSVNQNPRDYPFHCRHQARNLSENRNGQRMNILIVGGAGRLTYEAVLFAASLRHSDPMFQGQLFVADPAPGPLWPKAQSMNDKEALKLLEDLGAKVLPFEAKHFGASYLQGNKVEALSILPEGEPFIFFDTDTVIAGPLGEVPFDFERPSASMKREGTWPKVELYGPGMSETWKSLYDRLGLDFSSSLDPSQPDEHWEKYLYFNAGWFFGCCPAAFQARMLEAMLMVRDAPPDALVCQPIYPWLDQIALPLVIHGLGGGRPGPELDGLDGEISCHWRVLPLAYARESDRIIDTLEELAAPNRIKRVLKSHEPMKRMIYQGRGRKVRALFDQANLPRKEQAIRNTIKREGFWMR